MWAVREVCALAEQKQEKTKERTHVARDTVADENTKEIQTTAEHEEMQPLKDAAETQAAQEPAEEGEEQAAQETAEEDDVQEAQELAEEGDAQAAQEPAEEDDVQEAQELAEEGDAQAAQETAEEGEVQAAQEAAEEDDAQAAQEAAEEDGAQEAQETAEEGDAQAVQEPAEEGDAQAAQETAEEGGAQTVQEPAEEDDAQAAQKPAKEEEGAPGPAESQPDNAAFETEEVQHAQDAAAQAVARRAMQASQPDREPELEEVNISMPRPAPRAPFEKTPEQRAAEFAAKADALGRQWDDMPQPAQSTARQPARSKQATRRKQRNTVKKTPAKRQPAGRQSAQDAPVPATAPQASPAPAQKAAGETAPRHAGTSAPKAARRGAKSWPVWLAACLVLGAAGFFAGMQYAATPAAPAQSAVPSSVAPAQPTPDPTAPADPQLWSLLLANTQNPLPDGYEPPQLTTIDASGRQVDSRIADALQQMIAAAEKDGAHLVVTSAYRSYERQEELYVSMIREYLALGYSNADAYAATKRLRNVPGTSEHQTGLAVDIISQSYWQLDEGYANTYEARWLKEHAADYGFILRYPKDKTAITGTNFEPWHYRYVGVEDAQKIMAQGLCLEEYLAKVDDSVAGQVAAALENAGVAGTDTESGNAEASSASSAAQGAAQPSAASSVPSSQAAGSQS